MPTPDTIRIADKFTRFDAQWTPHRIGRFDDHQLLLARVEGEFVWHDHADHDEVFLPIEGTLCIDFEDGTTRRVGPGEILIVPRGVKHRPRTEDGECRLLVIDPMAVRHTGDVESERTVHEYPEI